MEKKYVINESEMKLIAETFYGECMGCDVSNECEGCSKMSEESIRGFWESREVKDTDELLALNREFAQALNTLVECVIPFNKLVYVPQKFRKVFDEAKALIESDGNEPEKLVKTFGAYTEDDAKRMRVYAEGCISDWDGPLNPPPQKNPEPSPINLSVPINITVDDPEKVEELCIKVQQSIYEGLKNIR